MLLLQEKWASRDYLNWVDVDGISLCPMALLKGQQVACVWKCMLVRSLCLRPFRIESDGLFWCTLIGHEKLDSWPVLLPLSYHNIRGCLGRSALLHCIGPLGQDFMKCRGTRRWSPRGSSLGSLDKWTDSCAPFDSDLYSDLVEDRGTIAYLLLDQAMAPLQIGIQMHLQTALSLCMLPSQRSCIQLSPKALLNKWILGV